MLVIAGLQALDALAAETLQHLRDIFLSPESATLTPFEASVPEL